MMSTQVLHLNPYQVHYREWGRGQPLLLLHGFFGSGQNWEALAGLLGDQFHCFAPDLLGFGQSSKPSLKYTVWHQVDFIRAFVQALGLSHYSVVGHSYGGWTAAACALHMKDIAHLTLIAPAGIRDDEFVGRYRYMRPLLWQSPWVDWGLRAIAPVGRWLGQAATVEMLLKVRTALTEQPVARSFLCDRLRPEDAIDTLEKDLHHIQVPALVIAGGEDKVIPLWHCQTFAAGIAKAKYHLLPKAGHDLIQTHAAVIAEILLADCDRAVFSEDLAVEVPPEV
ncbi:alpha/beta fold hydrolase [Lyngbya confervoides]|uniref:Alpha/beta hydrolase n=1 Tax=Lyngbya confervoides BDU141951 TaxID=1574623 RepID=A0ABD4SZQ6_9CYAN|nr:alpha/beta hydrolase [Lyngbya confervoides]MCM1981802.1 alpha/beta hydrolase [Lyngbya confervoides BDU141951]